MENKKISKLSLFAVIFILLLVIIAVVVIVAVVNKSNEDKSDSKDGSTIAINNGKEKVKIKEAETKNIEFEKYDNSLVSFDYPKGWKVEVAPTDYIHYCFKVYDPEIPSYMFLFGLKQEGALKSEKARQVWASYYPESPFSKIEPIDPQTTEGYYKAYPKNAAYNNASFNNEFFPKLDNFSVIGNLGKDMVGGDILRATFTDSKGNKAQGIFTAAVKDVGSYYISENIWNPLGNQVDVWPLNTYNIVFMTAPDDDFINWQASLDHCLATIQFSDKFISGFNAQEDTIVASIQANQKVYDQVSDMIMDSWNKRSNSYDITSQKQSDATLGYERVYDTETGDIYKAYNGFTDDYKGDRYQPITDNMYTEAISGYIEK